MESTRILKYVIFLLVCYIVIRHVRNWIPRLYSTTTDVDGIESFSLSGSAEKEFNSIKSNTNIAITSRIQDMSGKHTSLPLKEYCIKSSYNSACTGDYVNLDMIKHVLTRGCRFVDFDVFYVKENDIYLPKVGFTSDIANNFIESKNTILLDDVLSTIATTAFSNPTPNKKDPVFINLRVKSNDSNIYTAVAKSIHANIKSIMYDGKVSKDTKLKELMGKVVVVFDKTIQRDYTKYAACDENDLKCYDIANYINMESGSEDINLFHYTELLEQSANPALIKDDNIHTNTKTIKMAVPDFIASAANPKVDEFIIKHGCQILTNRFDVLDDNLKKYEMMFNDNDSGIIPLSVAVPYMMRLNKS